MTSLHPVNTMRGVNLPAEIEPDFMYQVGGEDILMVHATNGVIYCRKGPRWYKMVEFTPKKGTTEDSPDPQTKSSKKKTAATA